MNIKTGCDLVNIQRFRKSAERGGENFLSKIFSENELNGSSLESLAGIFAAKESIIKATNLQAGDWKKIEIIKDEKGSPVCKTLDLGNKFISHDISISHDTDYAFATAVFLVK